MPPEVSDAFRSGCLLLMNSLARPSSETVLMLFCLLSSAVPDVKSRPQLKVAFRSSLERSNPVYREAAAPALENKFP